MHLTVFHEFVARSCVLLNFKNNKFSAEARTTFATGRRSSRDAELIPISYIISAFAVNIHLWQYGSTRAIHIRHASLNAAHRCTEATLTSNQSNRLRTSLASQTFFFFIFDRRIHSPTKARRAIVYYLQGSFVLYIIVDATYMPFLFCIHMLLFLSCCIAKYALWNRSWRDCSGRLSYCAAKHWGDVVSFSTTTEESHGERAIVYGTSFEATLAEEDVISLATVRICLGSELSFTTFLSRESKIIDCCSMFYARWVNN